MSPFSAGPDFTPSRSVGTISAKPGGRLRQSGVVAGGREVSRVASDRSDYCHIKDQAFPPRDLDSEPLVNQ